MHAYSELYLSRAQKNMGAMLEFAVCISGMNLSDFWNSFINSDIANRFGNGDPQIIAGKSGIELARLVFDEVGISYEATSNIELNTYGRTPEYWVGWALSYYQWYRDMAFARIQAIVKIEDVLLMYSPYHEMDIGQFCNEINRRLAQQHPNTKLAQRRKLLGLSQSDLSLLSEVSLRTIQHYEQREKDINKASVSQVFALSKALHCSVEDLIEPLNREEYQYAIISL